MNEFFIASIVSCFTAFFTVYFTIPPLIHYLQKRNFTVKDVNKKDTFVARPGGPSIILGILASEIILYVFFPLNEILAVMITSFLGFLIGYIDDRREIRRGWFKPVALILAALPIIVLGAYDTDLAFPLFGTVQIPVLYLVIILLMIPITGNTINSIDVLNGVASGFMTIAGFSLSISLFIIQNYEMALVSLPLGFVSLAFYKYHKIPSKIFPGDSGALALGSMYGAIAVVGHVEIIAAVALLPAIVNSFLFLSSVKKIVEHKQIKGKPVEQDEQFRLKATDDKTAPVTLVRLILAGGPLTEKQVGYIIFKLAIFSGMLAQITAFLVSVKI